MRPDEDVPIVPEVTSPKTDEPTATDGGERTRARASSDRRSDGGLQQSYEIPETTAPLVPNVSW